MYDTWCLSVTPDILNIPEIPDIPPIVEGEGGGGKTLLYFLNTMQNLDFLA